MKTPKDLAALGLEVVASKGKRIVARPAGQIFGRYEVWFLDVEGWIWHFSGTEAFCQSKLK